jgi:ABC-type lipoprotein release transport system permease subunit
MKSVSAGISLRNLLRQKRRSLLLGMAIAFGAMILILSNAFSHGISDVLFNKVMKFVTGHVSIAFSEKGNVYTQVFRDGDRVLQTIKKHAWGVATMSEAIGVFGRGIGNGRADNIILVGIDLSADITPEELEDTRRNFKMIVGDFTDLGDTLVENPLILSRNKAENLNLKKNDILRVRMSDINGMQQAARFTVVGIFEPANIFMSAPVFAEMRDLKRIMGYGPHDIATYYITLTDPRKNAIPLADTLHQYLRPGLAAIDAKADRGPLLVMGYRADSTWLLPLKSRFTVTAGDSAAAFRATGALLGEAAAKRLGVSPGDTVRVEYLAKHDSTRATARFAVSALYASSDPALTDEALLVNESRFYHVFYQAWPAPPGGEARKLLPAQTAAVCSLLAPEWILLPRAKNTEEVKQRYKEITRLKWKGAVMDVQTMYETGSDILKLEAALNLITLWAVAILFFIIVIGVVNTLRMTIRERTREIGTLRAIGMQKKDVRNSFILETVFLSAFASAAGTLLAFIAMSLLGLITFNTQDNPLGMILNNGRLHFVPSALGLIGYNLLILIMAAATAYFPARRAAKMPPAAALRHYE